MVNAAIAAIPTPRQVQDAFPDIDPSQFLDTYVERAKNMLRINYRDMGTEELGSVYESLLELTPRLINDGRGFDFAEDFQHVIHGSLVADVLELVAINFLRDGVRVPGCARNIRDARIVIARQPIAC